jgi:hypothetical protein
MIIDAWAQHLTVRHIQDPVFDSLRRWTRHERGGSLERPLEMPLSDTLRSMDEGGVSMAIHAIGSVLAEHMFAASQGRPFDATEYEARLTALTAESWRKSGEGT